MTTTQDTTQRKPGRPVTGRLKSVTITAFIEPAQKEKLHAIAIEQRRSVSSLIDFVLSRYITEWEKNK